MRQRPKLFENMYSPKQRLAWCVDSGHSFKDVFVYYFSLSVKIFIHSGHGSHMVVIPNE